MRDVVFRFGTPSSRYIDTVQRIAVLYHLRDVAVSEIDIAAKTQELVEQWRARVSVLTAAGWLYGTKIAHNQTYARNCLPAFVTAYPTTRVCGNRVVCPSCYARWVRNIWERIDADLHPPEEIVPGDRAVRGLTIGGARGASRRAASTYHLIERRHILYRPILPLDGSVDNEEQQLAALMRSIQVARNQAVKLVDPVGAFMYTTIEPTNDGLSWKIQHRQLFKLLADHPFPTAMSENVNGYVTRHEQFTRADLVQIVGRVCQYPKRLMIGDPKRIVQLLYVRDATRFKGNACFRSFRNGFDGVP